MACSTGGVDSQETGTLEVDSEGGKPRRGPEERDVDLSDRSLATSSTGGDIQEQTDLLTLVVSEAVHTLTPKAKPSPYTKKWWTSDLTRLRKEYTQLRNRATKIRRIGARDRKLEVLVKEASKQYHNAIRKQKKDHWDDFLADDANIWQATKYLSPNQGSSVAVCTS